MHFCRKILKILLFYKGCTGTGLVMYGYRAWCPGTGPSFWFSFLLIPSLLFEEATGECHGLLLLNDVYAHAKDERNCSNSFRVMAKNVTCVRVLVR